MTRTTSILAAGVLALLVVGCHESSDAPVRHEATLDDHADHHHVEELEGSRLRQEIVRYSREETFQQVGLRFDSPEASPRIEYRVLSDDGEWSPWSEVTVTWSETPYHVGRILLDAPAMELELRSGGDIEDALLEFYPEVVADPERLARDLPLAERPQVPMIGAIAPRELVIPRAEWGARNPNKVCGSPHNPYRMSIHHTASPDNDGGDPAARMRQMQAYHIDSNGWCDIGYHFVVSQSGQIFQGRSDEQRTGAHVGNQNSGNIGISLIGNFQAQQVSQTQFDATARIVGWVHQTYGIPLSRDVVKGHREWPGQGTSCPGNNLLAKLPDILTAAENGGIQYDADIQVRYLGVDDIYQEGSSAGIADALPGETVQAEIVLTNKSSGPLRGVQLGYWLESPFLRATNYVIQTDHPEKDGKSWKTNDADSAEGNPPKDAMGAEGALTMYAFGAGESKRVLIDLEVVEPSLGAADHPDVRGWVKHIDDLYGEQNAFNEDPTNANQFEKHLQAFAQLDVLPTQAWHFDGGEAELLEGWSSCNDDITSLSVSPDEGGVLVAEIAGSDSCLTSPAWTAVDAERFDQVVVRLQSSAGSHPLGVFWKGEGEEYDAQRSVVVDVDASQMQTVVVPVGSQTTWGGTINGLRIDPIEGVDQQATVSIDAVFFQSSQTRETSSPGELFIESAPVDTTTDNPGTSQNPGSTNGQNQQQTPTQPFDNPEDVRVNEGCSSTGSGPTSLWLIALALVGLAAGTRRRSKA